MIGDGRTVDVSAGGLRLRGDRAHLLRHGDRLEVCVFARVASTRDQPDDLLPLATNAVVVRADAEGAAVRFLAPLAF